MPNFEDCEGFAFGVVFSMRKRRKPGEGRAVSARLDAAGKAGLELHGFVAAALVDLYAKCGDLDDALKVFLYDVFFGSAVLHFHSEPYEWI
ncbi:hypothetical protein Droror1_Dr00020040 [Drosera rotundifolia]